MLDGLFSNSRRVVAKRKMGALRVLYQSLLQDCRRLGETTPERLRRVNTENNTYSRSERNVVMRGGASSDVKRHAAAICGRGVGQRVPRGFFTPIFEKCANLSAGNVRLYLGRGSPQRLYQPQWPQTRT
jgi:hypothetical protein